jgi:hypothetical protein
MQVYRGAVAAGGHHFDERRRFRHHYGTGQAEPRRVIRHCLAVIARARRDHSRFAFGFGQGLELVARTALLERPGPLQIFELQVERTLGVLAQARALRVRRHEHLAGDLQPRSFDVRQG